MSKRRVIKMLPSLVASFALFFLLSGCDRKPPPPEGRTPGTGLPTIRVLGEDSSNLQAIEALNSRTPFPNAKVEFAKHSFEDALQKANLDFAQSTGLYDIVLQYNFSLSSFARHRYVLTVDELKDLAPNAPFDAIEKSLLGFPHVWKEVGWYFKAGSTSEADAIPIGFPFAANTMLLVTNHKLFADAANQERYKTATGRDLAPPTTWDDFRQIAEFFTDKERGTYGVCLQGQHGGWLYYEWCNFLFGMGGTVMAKNRGWACDSATDIEIDNAAAVKAAQFYVALRPFNAGDFLATGASEQKLVLLQGNTAMAIVWSDYLWGLVQEGRAKQLQFDFSPIPGTKSMIAGGSFYINRKSKNARLAAEYVLSLLSDKNQVQLILNGLCSPVRAAYDSAAVAEQVPYSRALRDSLDRGVYMAEAGPDSDAIQTVITEQLQRLWQGEGTAEERLREARKQIEHRRKAIWDAVKSGG
jgi:ABC-type glycerol-3-phosphate transport system substrate-binding protein